MAVHVITRANSVDTTGTGLEAFDQVTGRTPNVLLVAQGASLRADTNVAIRLDEPAPWNVVIAGSIASQFQSGVLLTSGGTSQLNILRSGRIEGAYNGVTLDGNVTIRNYGTIIGTGAFSYDGNGIAMFADGYRTVVNYGVITGTVASIYDAGEFAYARITNFGTLNGDVSLGYADDILTNYGRINGNVTGGATSTGDVGTIRVTNLGTIDGYLAGGDGADVLVNRGTITGMVSLGTSVASDIGNRFTNSGKVLGDVASTGSGDAIVNTGYIAGSVTFGFGASTLRNSGIIEGNIEGLLSGSGGDETIINTGVIAGEINLGAGNDKYIGGNKVDEISDSIGSDTYVLNGGSDSFHAFNSFAGDADDFVDGGGGIDTYDALGAQGPLVINLDTRSHGSAAANAAIGADIGTVDNIRNFENVVGSVAADAIYGTAGANFLDGHGSGDTIYGLEGNDTLMGGHGDDVLIGGKGRDRLLGNHGDGAGDGGYDTYVFENLSDSPSGGGRDIIVEFEDGFDRIDVSALDANVRNGSGNDTFDFIGTGVSFNRVVGELRAYSNAAGWIVEGDVNGDGRADFSVQLNDADHLIVLTSADFIL